MLATPTPALYMESLADAAKGKAKAAEREAEKEKEEEAKKKERRLNKKRSPPAATPTANRPRRPSDAAPQRACALAAARVRADAERRPAWVLAAARVRAVAEGHQGHGAAGMSRPHAGRHAFWRTATGATLCGRFKMVAWPRAGLLCKEGQIEHGVGISAWSAAVSYTHLTLPTKRIV